MQTRCANLPDVQLEDFVRFCQFAYRGDYTSPQCVIDESTAQQGKEKPERASSESNKSVTLASCSSSDRSIQCFQDWSNDENQIPHAFFQTSPHRRILKDMKSYFALFLSGKKGLEDYKEESEDGSEDGSEDDSESSSESSSDSDEESDVDGNEAPLPKPVQLRKEFLSQNFLNGQIRDCLVMECGVMPNRTPEEDYTPVFLGHARLYVFADKYGISILRALSLDKLHRTLTYFTLFSERIGDILALARYAYKNTPNYENEVVDDLRRLVTQYIVCQFWAFENTDEFYSLLEEGGQPFIRDWWNLVRKYQIRMEGWIWTCRQRELGESGILQLGGEKMVELVFLIVLAKF